MMSFSQKTLKKWYEEGDPTVDLVGEPFGKFGFYVIYGDSPPQKINEPPCKPEKPSSVPPML